MDFQPIPLTVEQLSSQHPTYSANSAAWYTIDTLRSGFDSIQKNVEKYLPKRPVEDDELYTLRTAKLCYSPVMSHVVRTYAGKLTLAGIDFPENADHVWGDLRENNAAKGQPKRSEMALISDIFRSLMYFGVAYTIVDMPVEASAARSVYDLKASKLKPYFTVISPLDVINWGDGWYILKQFVQDTAPFAPVGTFALFSYVGQDITVRYKVPVKIEDIADSQGNLVPTISKVLIKGEWEKPDETMFFEPTEILPGVGSDRLVRTALDTDEWLCGSLYNKQIQHLRIENAWTDAGYLSGTVQRVFTPSDPHANDDPRVSYSDDQTAKELAQAGNTHILIGKGYSFVESSGTALGNLEGMLDKIESQIKVIANLHFASSQKTGLQQSGLSKRLDMVLLEGVMMDYGAVVLDTYNSLLQMVAKIIGVSPVEVGGLSDYQEKDIELTLNTITTISPLLDFPEIARKAIYRKLLEDSDIVLSEDDDKILDIQLTQTSLPTLAPPATPNLP